MSTPEELRELRDAFIDALALTVYEGSVTIRELGIEHTTEITAAVRDLVYFGEKLSLAHDPDLASHYD